MCFHLKRFNIFSSSLLVVVAVVIVVAAAVGFAADITHTPCHRHDGCGVENGNKRKIASIECQRAKLENFLLIWCVYVCVCHCPVLRPHRACGVIANFIFWQNAMVITFNCHLPQCHWHSAHPCRGDSSSSVGSLSGRIRVRASF